MPMIDEALREAWEKAREHDNTRDPRPGEHADPFAEMKDPSRNPHGMAGPPLQNPLWKSIDTSGMTPAEAVKIWQREYGDALASGDRERIDQASRNLELAQTEALVPQMPIDPIDQETRELGEQGRRMNEIDNMLIKDGVFGGKRSTFFTDTWDGFGKDDPDEAAYRNLQTFGTEPEESEAYKNYWRSIDIMGTFTDAERKYVNANNSINTAVNDAMTDKTGQRLVELLTELRDNTRELHIEERP